MASADLQRPSALLHAQFNRRLMQSLQDQHHARSSAPVTPGDASPLSRGDDMLAYLSNPGSPDLRRGLPPLPSAGSAGQSPDASPNCSSRGSFGTRLTQQMQPVGKKQPHGESHSTGSNQSSDAPGLESPNSVCLNSADVENVCAEMEMDKVQVASVDIIPVNEDESVEYVIWAVRFSNSTAYLFPGTGNTSFTSIEQPQQPQKDEKKPAETMDTLAAGFVEISVRTKELDESAYPKYVVDDDLGSYIFG